MNLEHLDVEIVPTENTDEPSTDITSVRLQFAGISFRKMPSKAMAATGNTNTKTMNQLWQTAPRVVMSGPLGYFSQAQ